MGIHAVRRYLIRCGKDVSDLFVCKNIRFEILMLIRYNSTVNHVRGDVVSDHVFGQNTDQRDTAFLAVAWCQLGCLHKRKAQFLWQSFRAVVMFALFIQDSQKTLLFVYLYPNDRFSSNSPRRCPANGPVKVLSLDIAHHLHFQRAFGKAFHVNTQIVPGSMGIRMSKYVRNRGGLNVVL